VRGTPTIIVNGALLQTEASVQNLDRLVRRELDAGTGVSVWQRRLAALRGP
jgi:hypothetical protein